MKNGCNRRKRKVGGGVKENETDEKMKKKIILPKNRWNRVGL